MPTLESQNIQLIIVAAVAVAMLLQGIVLLAALMIARKAIHTLHQQIEELRTSVLGMIGKAEPVLDGARELLARTGPKIEATVTDLAAISQNLRKETNDVQAAAAEIIEKMRRQSTRVDSMLTRVFDVIDHATSFMSDAVSKPMRQVAGVLASAKAVVETLRNGAPDTAPAASTGDHSDKGTYV